MPKEDAKNMLVDLEDGLTKLTVTPKPSGFTKLTESPARKIGIIVLVFLLVGTVVHYRPAIIACFRSNGALDKDQPTVTMENVEYNSVDLTESYGRTIIVNCARGQNIIATTADGQQMNAVTLVNGVDEYSFYDKLPLKTATVAYRLIPTPGYATRVIVYCLYYGSAPPADWQEKARDRYVALGR